MDGNGAAELLGPSTDALDRVSMALGGPVPAVDVAGRLDRIDAQLAAIREHVAALDAFTAQVSAELSPVVAQLQAGGLSGLLFGKHRKASREG
jgi:hypothetical protein